MELQINNTVNFIYNQKMAINKGKQLKFVREYRGFSQSDLSNKIDGLSQSNLSKFEKGFSSVLSDELIEKIMNFLNWPIEFLEKENRDIQLNSRHYLKTKKLSK